MIILLNEANITDIGNKEREVVVSSKQVARFNMSGNLKS
jgi:hypothetical protein